MVKVRGRNSNRKTVKQTAENWHVRGFVTSWCHTGATSQSWQGHATESRCSWSAGISPRRVMTRCWYDDDCDRHLAHHRDAVQSGCFEPWPDVTGNFRNFESFWYLWASCRHVSIVDCSNGVFSSINRLRWTVKIMLSLLSNFWSRAIRTKAQLPWLSTRTTLFMCSWLLAHRRQTAKKKDHPNLLPVLEVALEQRISLRCIGFGWLRSPISINQESEDNIELLPLYHVPCVTLCTLLSLSCQTTLTKWQKKKKKKKKKDCQMSVYHKADPGELIQWVTPESRSSAASNSGLIRIGTQPRTADAWHHDSCRPRGVVTRDFSAIFDRLFDRLPVRISTSDLYHWILRKKIFHIRAYDFGVQFSFNCAV